jgi:hypothetical protein
MFKDIVSGHYGLSIIKPNWCWDMEDQLVKVQNANLQDLTFKQTG